MGERIEPKHATLNAWSLTDSKITRQKQKRPEAKEINGHFIWEENKTKEEYAEGAECQGWKS